METATYLLFVLGCLGATDIALFHSVAHGIREHPDARRELLAHSLRGPTYAALFLVVPNFRPGGAWFWALAALLVVDVAISIWDFAIEGNSRCFLGGLPAGEYVLHMVMAMVFGALAATVAFEAGQWGMAPTSLAYEPAAVPDLLRLAMAAMALLVLLSGVQDALAARRLRGRPIRATEKSAQTTRDTSLK